MSVQNRSIKIFIDNSDAMSSAKKLRSEINRLETDLKSLAAEGKKESAGYKRNERDLAKLTKSYATHQNKVQETERVLKNLSGATLPDLYRTRSMLRGELSKTERGTDKYNKTLKIHGRVQKEISLAQRELNGQYGRQGTLMSKMTSGFNKYFGIATAFVASITGMSFAFRKLSQDAAAMEDTYADVMKTTGLTREEVGELNDELKKMDTRTAREQLNMLARDAGKLGMSSKKDILDFVEAANIIQVALGEDLGEDAIKSIGKMSNVFQNATKEIEDLDLKGRMLSIGSAVNEVAQSSSASEPYLVAFAGRLGGVAAQAGIGIDKILGFASALDQDMQAVEMSATALQKLIIKIMSSPAEFAAIANMEVGKFTNLLQTDANEAIKTVLRSLNEKGGFQELIPIFQEMGLDGARAVGVLSSMANGIDRIDEAQSIANKSMIEATSVMDEYNIKNQNAQAELEKRKKAFKDAAEELGNRLNPALLKSTNYLTYLIKVLPDVLDFFAKWGPLLAKATAILLTYNIALKATSLWKRIAIVDSAKLHLLLLREQATLTILAAKQVLAARTTRQLAATMKRLFATMSLNPFALIVTAVVALGYAIYKLSNQSAKLLTKQVALINVTEKANKAIAGERAELDLLLSVARDESIAKDKRIEAIEKLNKISPEYLGNLNLENINTKNATTSIEAYSDALLENAKKKAIAERVSELYGKQMDAEMRLIEAKAKKEKYSKYGDVVVFGPDYQSQKIEEEITQLEKEIDLYAELNKEIIKNTKIKKSGDDTSTDGSTDSTEGKGSPVSETEEERKERLKKEAEAYENHLKQKLAILDSYMQEEKNKLMQQRLDGSITQDQYLRDLEALEMEGMISKMNIYKLDSDQQIAIQNLIYDKKIKILQKLESDELAYQKRLLDNQKAADKARAEQNWANLKAIGKQNEQDAKEKFEKQQKQKQELFEIGMDFSNEMGSMVGGLISGNEDIVASSLKSIINMGLDMLKVQVQMAVAGATAMSLAQPDSVLTFGKAGFARAAIMVGLIEAAFSAVKGVVSSAIGNMGSNKASATISNDALTGQRVVTQRQHGKYDVLGADDGRLYSNVPYIGDARTGVVSTPTLMGEYGSELVVNAPDFKALQRHVNYPVVLEAIQQSRQPYRTSQRAEGNYSQLPPAQSTPSADSSVMVEMVALLRDLKTNGVKAPVVLSDLQRKQELLSTSQKIGSK